MKKKAVQENPERLVLSSGDPKGTRTPVTGVRGQCPRPLDDGAQWCCFITDPAEVVNTLLTGKINSKSRMCNVSLGKKTLRGIVL